MKIPVWKWLTRVYQAPGINPEEMDTSEIACIFFQDTQILIHPAQLPSKELNAA